MSIFLDEFKADLSRMRRLIDALILLRKFSGINITAETANPFLDHAKLIHSSASSCNADIVILCGSSILYIAGRFEFFVRAVFEELCESVAKKCNSFDKLPRIMRTNLIGFTAEVMKEPRKYGHGENGVEAFIKNLAGNLSDKTKLDDVNYACLSITHENMRPDILEDLFSRIGADKIWEKLGQQASIQAFYETAEPVNAQNKVTKELNVFMDLRNKIAHPSSDVTWPDSDKVLHYLGVFEMLAESIVQVSRVYEVSLPTREFQKQRGTQGTASRTQGEEATSLQALLSRTQPST